MPEAPNGINFAVTALFPPCSISNASDGFKTIDVGLTGMSSTFNNLESLPPSVSYVVLYFVKTPDIVTVFPSKEFSAAYRHPAPLI